MSVGRFINHCSKHTFIIFSQQHCKVGIITLISKVRKVRIRKANRLARVTQLVKSRAEASASSWDP